LGGGVPATPPALEIADLIRTAGAAFVERNRQWIRWKHVKVLLAIARCRTAALGGHIDECTSCAQRTPISYNSCRDRHCRSVFIFVIGVSLLSSFLFGMSPAWQASKVDLSDALKQAGRGLAGSSNRLRNSLVVVQVALSFALAIGAGLLFRSFLMLSSVELGYRTQSMLVMSAHDPARRLSAGCAVLGKCGRGDEAYSWCYLRGGRYGRT